MAVTACINEELAKKILDAYHQLSLLMEQYDLEFQPDSQKYRSKFEEKVESFLNEFEPPKLHIPDEADLSLVSIGEYDREDYWGCNTYNLLVDEEHAEEMERVVKDMLEECRTNDFFRDIIATTDEILRLRTYGYALEHGITVYREFFPDYSGIFPDKLHEQFIPDYA